MIIVRPSDNNAGICWTIDLPKDVGAKKNKSSLFSIASIPSNCLPLNSSYPPILF